METLLIILSIFFISVALLIRSLKKNKGTKSEIELNNGENHNHDFVNELLNYKTVTLREIPSEILDTLSLNVIDTLTNEINQKREYNKLRDDFLQSLIRKDFELYEKIGKYFLWGYYDVFTFANKEEKKGNLLNATKIYWYNILINGTDSPGHYDRLLVCLNKLNLTEKELVVAMLHLRLNSENHPSVGEKMIKRIKRLEKKLKNSLQ